MPEITEAGTVILIPAYNEEKQIGNAISLIRQTGIDAHIIVINDGSSDRTAEIANSMGCEVIDLPRHAGKATAVFAGIRRAIRLNARATVMLDADLTGLPKNSLDKLVASAEEATHEGRVHMTIACQNEEGNPESIYDISGQRSFSNRGLYLIDKARTRTGIKGFGLEQFLNEIFKGRTEEVPHAISTLKPFRTSNAEEQFRERVHARGVARKQRDLHRRL
ncbi:MAG: glycosyltransferase family 2 protein [Candidatus Diapherotrites archaeon]|nr:glycosyltransferase family 2 protein [Candidatus Diapherotrites archaeon]